MNKLTNTHAMQSFLVIGLLSMIGVFCNLSDVSMVLRSVSSLASGLLIGSAFMYLIMLLVFVGQLINKNNSDESWHADF